MKNVKNKVHNFTNNPVKSNFNKTKDKNLKTNNHNNFNNNNNISINSNTDSSLIKFGKKQLERTKISQLSEKTNFNFKYEFMDNRTNNLTDKIIEVRKKESKSNNPLGISPKNEEEVLLSKLDKINEKFTGFSIVSLKEQNIDYEKVEKSYLDNLRKENDQMTSANKSLIDQMNEMKYNCRLMESEIEMLKQIKEAENKSQQDKKIKLKSFESAIYEAEELNKRLQKIYKKEKMEKDNKYLALINILNSKDSKLVDRFEEINKSYNNQYFLSIYKPRDEEIVEELLSKIETKEKEIYGLNTRLAYINKILVKQPTLPIIKSNTFK